MKLLPILVALCGLFLLTTTVGCRKDIMRQSIPGYDGNGTGLLNQQRTTYVFRMTESAGFSTTDTKRFDISFTSNDAPLPLVTSWDIKFLPKTALIPGNTIPLTKTFSEQVALDTMPTLQTIAYNGDLPGGIYTMDSLMDSYITIVNIENNELFFNMELHLELTFTTPDLEVEQPPRLTITDLFGKVGLPEEF